MYKQMQEKPFSYIEISTFCSQFAMILQSGISYVEGIAIMQEDASCAEERKILQTIVENVQKTGSLYQALNDTKLFPSYMVHMIQIGEETGTLDEVMSALTLHYDREDSIVKSIRSAITYPLIMSGMMVIIILILLVKVMPVFSQVFIQLGTEMTGFSKTLMNLGIMINRYSIAFAAVLILVTALGLFSAKTEKGRRICRNLGYKFKFTRSIYEEIAACRFAGGMALTLNSGLNPERSIELASTLNEDVHFLKKMDFCRHLIDEGKALQEALHTAGIFTGLYAHLVSIGAKTGSMDKVMNKIAELYQDDIDTRMSNGLAVLEPTLVITLSLIVGIILLSVMLPLMGIMSSI